MAKPMTKRLFYLLSSSGWEFSSEFIGVYNNPSLAERDLQAIVKLQGATKVKEEKVGKHELTFNLYQSLDRDDPTRLTWTGAYSMEPIQLNQAAALSGERLVRVMDAAP